MELYKIISQLTESEYKELLSSFTSNKADKTASFLSIIRKNPTTPDKEFLKTHTDVSASAFYVLKSRLNKKVEAFLLNRVGDPNLDVISRVLKANETIFENSRQISIAALNHLEKELLRLDFPYGLMVMYKLMQNLHAFDEDSYDEFGKKYSKQVAYSVAMDKASDLIVQFFRSFDSYMLTHKDEDHTRMLRVMEKIDNLSNLYDSHRLYIFKAIIHLYGKLFIELNSDLRCELEKTEVIFDKAFDILTTYQEDPFYKNIHLLFDYLRYMYLEKEQKDKAKFYYELLDFKIDELMTGYHHNANTSLFLYSKLRFHIQNNTPQRLLADVEQYLSNIEVDQYRPAFYINYQMFLAYTHFLNHNYSKSNRILYSLRNTISFRKFVHSDLEVKFLLAIGYCMAQDTELANQLIMSLQRQLRVDESGKYEHCKVLLKILTVAVGSRSSTRRKNLEKYIPQWKAENVGKHAILADLNLASVFLDGGDF
ncbi:MAG: hypothetical protein ACKVTZ_17960 [Bacteroidia bacterium]